MPLNIMVLDPETRGTKWLIIDDHSDSIKRGRQIENSYLDCCLLLYRLSNGARFRISKSSDSSFYRERGLMKRNRCAGSLSFFSILRPFDIYPCALYFSHFANMINDREPDRENNIFLATRPANENRIQLNSKFQRQRGDFKVHVWFVW